MADETEVAIVGGGIAGAALATRLAIEGREVCLFERHAEPRWRACGVYSSPLTRARLAELGLRSGSMDQLIRPIEVMEVRSTRGPVCRLDYEPPACGLARPALDLALLDRAREAGARVCTGAVVRSLEPGRRLGEPARLTVATAAGDAPWRSRLVVGADGPRSLVARAFGVDRPVRRLRHAGLTVHRADPAASHDGAPARGRMIIGRGWYCGIAPVPGGRVNIGIVMGERMLRDQLASAARGGATAIVAGVIEDLPRIPDATGLDPAPDLWRSAPDSDEVRVALPLAHRVERRAGPGFVLIGDAAGFVDPLSGDGIHRALRSAELAAPAIIDAGRGRPEALARYDRQMRATFAPKDLLSWVLQVFLARPQMLDYGLRRLARRQRERAVFASVLADQAPARAALTPRYLVGLLAP